MPENTPMNSNSACPLRIARREFWQRTVAALAAAALSPVLRAQSAAPGTPPAGVPGTIQDFEQQLKRMRFELYHHPTVDIVEKGFRPVGGQLADFATVHHAGRDHFFYIERRLQEGTPFFPGHEIYFGHASTPDFFTWEVHDPVMLVRPGTWEEAHVWAPMILRVGREFVMAYTGLNRHLSQNIGLASSRDLFTWKRWRRNPLSPCRNAAWASWSEDDIASCRDPHLLHHGGRFWMVYTANTRTGATCLALASSLDLRRWQDHGPILTGPTSGYEPRLWGGHAQGSYESANLCHRLGRWFLVFTAATRERGRATWAVASDQLDSFERREWWRFWDEGGCVEVVRDRGERSLIAGVVRGCLRFGEVNWAEAQPAVRTIQSREQLAAWQTA